MIFMTVEIWKYENIFSPQLLITLTAYVPPPFVLSQILDPFKILVKKIKWIVLKSEWQYHFKKFASLSRESQRMFYLDLWRETCRPTRKLWQTGRPTNRRTDRRAHKEVSLSWQFLPKSVTLFKLRLHPTPVTWYC